MKIKESLVLRNVVNECIVAPAGDHIAQFEGAVVLNEVSTLICKKLENSISRDGVWSAVFNEYDVDEAQTAEDMGALLAQFESMRILEK